MERSVSGFKAPLALWSDDPAPTDLLSFDAVAALLLMRFSIQRLILSRSACPARGAAARRQSSDWWRVS
jgi:hypothetical protein